MTAANVRYGPHARRTNRTPITLAEAARRLDTSVDGIWTLIAEGQIPRYGVLTWNGVLSLPPRYVQRLVEAAQ